MIKNPSPSHRYEEKCSRGWQRYFLGLLIQSIGHLGRPALLSAVTSLRYGESFLMKCRAPLRSGPWCQSQTAQTRQLHPQKARETRDKDVFAQLGAFCQSRFCTRSRRGVVDVGCVSISYALAPKIKSKMALLNDTPCTQNVDI